MTPGFSFRLNCRAGWLASAWLSLAAVGVAAEPAWLVDPAAATAQAARQGKLLLVVHLSGDFTAGAARGTEADLYRTVTLANRRVTALLAERFVVLAQPVGPPDSLRPIPPRLKVSAGQPSSRGSEFAITYICLPDRRVLHFIPGFASSEELLAELAWVERAYSEQAKASAAGEHQAIRNSHLAKVAAADRISFATQFPSRWQEGQLRHGPSTVDLPAALRAARAAQARGLAGRVAARSDGRALQALAAHGSLGVELAHLILTEFPLIDLDDLARPAFEACAQRRFWSATNRRASLAQRWAECRSRKQPLLLVVADDPFAAQGGDSEPFAWPPANAASVPGLARLPTETVSIDELAQFITDAGLAAVNYRPSHGPPRFLLLSGTEAGPAIRIARSEGTTRLAQAIAALEPGALAVEVAAERGEDDERE